MSSSAFVYALLRLEFGLSAAFHFLFVPLSLGLLLCVNILQTAYARTGLALYRRTARFWRNLFLLTWLAGVCTGYPLRWQVMNNWGGFAQAASKVFAEVFAIEGTVGPFMLAGVVLLAVGKRLLGTWLHMVVGWLLLFLLVVQSHTILSVNAWMQHPVGVSFGEGLWQLQSLAQVLLNDTAQDKLWHTLSGAMLAGAMCVMAVSATWLLRRQHVEVANAGMRIGAWVGMLGVVSALWSGHVSAVGVTRHQPMKFAAFEAHWERGEGLAPLVLLALPDEKVQRNRYAVEVPCLLSLLASGGLATPPGIMDLTREHERRLVQLLALPVQTAGPRSHDGPRYEDPNGLLALYASMPARYPDEWPAWSAAKRIEQTARAARPSVAGTFWAFRAMVGSGVVLMGLCTWAFVRRRALALGQHGRLLRALRWGLPLPWIAILSGWAVAEIGRQPWTVQGHLPTLQAMQAPPLPQAVGMAALLLAGAALVATAYALAWLAIFKAGPDRRLRRRGMAGWSGKTSVMGA